MKKLFERLSNLVKLFLLKPTLQKVRELIQAHIDSGSRSMYWQDGVSETQNIKNMIHFYQVAFEDGYFSYGKYFEASQWMSVNPDEVIEIYFEMKEDQHGKDE